MDSSTSTILLVDDDRHARMRLADNLTADGYEVLEAETIEAAQRLMYTSLLDLAIIDLGLPDGDGLDLLRLVRDAGENLARVDSNLPLIVTSGRNTTVDRVRGFERGCDDYIATPYSYTELRARVAALLRRCERAKAGTRMRVGPLEVDPISRQTWIAGVPLQLSTKEFALLRVLVGEPERVFTRAELLRSVWGWQDTSAATCTRTLDSHASRLRRKLAEHGLGFVVNVWGVGYRLIDGTPSG